MAGFLFLICVAFAHADGTSTEFFRKHCFDCHSGDSVEGDVSLQTPPTEWDVSSTGRYWEAILDVLDDRRMPPPEMDQPTNEERESAIRGIHALLQSNVRPGGTRLRRLNRREYENSISRLLGISFRVPESFPGDQLSHGFDNIGEGLILSPPLLQQYFELATTAADSVLPPVPAESHADAKDYTIGPKNFSWYFTAAQANEDSVRVVTSSANFGRSGIWPSNFEARVSGEYSLSFRMQAFKPVSDHPLKVSLIAIQNGAGYYKRMNELRSIATIEVPIGRPLDVDTTVQLYRGEVFGVHLDSLALDAEKNQTDHLERVLRSKFSESPKLHAAWLKVGFENRDRGGYYWQKISAAMNDPDLVINDLSERSEETESLIKLLKRNPVNVVEALAVQHFETGPGLDVGTVHVRGPLRLIDGPQELKQQQLTSRFLGERNGRSDTKYARAILGPLISDAYRRPATEQQIDGLTKVAIEHIRDGARFEDGIHLAVRSILCSPRFLYRGHTPGRLDDYDLATRLSYFLTSAPPDASLQKLAEQGKLATSDGLEKAARSLLRKSSRREFDQSFTGQWLGTRRLADIMPDERLMNFNQQYRKAMIDEIEMSFTEILDRNLSIENFIDPDFTYLNKRLHAIYRYSNIHAWPAGKKESSERFKTKSLTDNMLRVAIPRGDRIGGILCQAGVMMTTANGVDTQPVLRGVWMLENVFGESPPPPPSSVPAVEPDTTGAQSIRELLKKHRADSSCESCHRRIDPLGFALENFDPIGRWRDHYPIYEKQSDGAVQTKEGLPVDAAGVLNDGTRLTNVRDLKKYLAANIDIFSRCLAEKLLVYATGRPLNYADKQVVEQIVRDVRGEGNGFQDLVIAVISSDSFRTR